MSWFRVFRVLWWRLGLGVGWRPIDLRLDKYAFRSPGDIIEAPAHRLIVVPFFRFYLGSL